MNYLLDEYWREKLKNRFLKYVSFYSTSKPNVDTIPSTERQWEIANYIKTELEEIGMSNVQIDEHAYVTASLPANSDTDVSPIGFISHFDTSPDFSGENVQAKIWENYSGESLVLNDQGFTLSIEEFPEMKQYKGQTLITTDGTTLLGADDKAGIAEIVTAMEYLLENQNIEHRTLKVGFTPDEEVGKGAHKFDVEGFGAAWAYTMDGGEIGELEFENFNAASAVITFKGKSVHPGSAKDKMVNAGLLAQEFLAKLPKEETPATTEGYEGFYHLTKTTADVSSAELQFIIRDHDAEKFEDRKKQMIAWVEEMKNRYGQEAIGYEIKDQYFNMREKIVDKPYIMETAEKAFQRAGVVPNIKPIRGGTDGSQLSFMGLPCPNIFAGGHNFHGPYEYVPLESMMKATEIIIYIAQDLKS